MIAMSPARVVLTAELVGGALLLLFVGGMTYSTGQYFLNPKYLKDDWRGLVRHVEANAWPRDARARWPSKQSTSEAA